ncbi:hypothetical protein ILUMI_01154 [Ignelater luminosus]|uniref:Uncharacterized protein n=1 Tax=Ignelater luminosus TaxID=2038154 RepID=A0A8K0GMH7_IGNLU|nr:hypothetical protein ILUMI_01154 [Ignelater luminosus]
MKFAIVVLSVLATALAQRPRYASSSPVGHSEIAPRFKIESNDLPPVAPNPNDYNNVPPEGIPIDAHSDIELMNRLNALPKPNRPIWYLNPDQIEANRNTYRYPASDSGNSNDHYPDGYNYQPEIQVVML